MLKQLEEPNVIDDFIDNYDEYKKGTKIFVKSNNNNFLNDDDIESQKIKYFKEERFKDLLIERRKHFCNSNLMSIRKNFSKFRNNNNKDKIKNRINNTQTVHISKRQFSRDIMDNDNERNNRIERIVTQVSKGNKNKISFVKEKVEKNIFDDGK